MIRIPAGEEWKLDEATPTMPDTANVSRRKIAVRIAL